jgi:hypothetical protein
LATSHKDETVIFLHIPKTAGTTLHNIIGRQYRASEMHTMLLEVPESIKQFLALSEAERGQFKMIRGHMGYGLHKFIPRPCQYFTILRNPVARAISIYYYIKRTPSHFLYNIFKEENLTLKDYVESGYSNMVDDGQTRMLAGGDGNILEGVCTPEMFEQAKENLHRSFVLVGLTERFDESLLLLGHQFGWRKPFYRRKNVSPHRLEKEALEPKILEAILAMNQYDLALYEYAQSLFEEQIEKGGISFKLETSVFTKANLLLNRFVATRPGSKMLSGYRQFWERVNQILSR